MHDLQEGNDLFELQVLQLRRADLRQQALKTIWKYRRPAASVGLAVFIGVLSFWLRNDWMVYCVPRKILELFKIFKKR